MLVVSEDLVRKYISPDECIKVVENGFQLLAQGKITNAYTQMGFQKGEAALHLYASSVPGYGIGAKVLGAYEKNPIKGKPYIYATMIMVDPATGKLVAILDAGYLTALRTAAASTLGTRYLSRKDSKVLGILGTGLQARTHLQCHCVDRSFERVVVWAWNPDEIGPFLQEMRPLVYAPIDVLDTPDDVCIVSDVISCVTRARYPLFSASSVRPGTHLNVVGPMSYDMSEIPRELLSTSQLFVDSKSEFISGWQNDAVPNIEAELGDVIAGYRTGRVAPDSITIFKPVGMAFEDIVTARSVIDNIERKLPINPT